MLDEAINLTEPDISMETVKDQPNKMYESENPLSSLPLSKVHVFWLAGMSCDGCTVAVAGATNPPLD